MLSREATTRAYQDYWVTMAEFWFKLARHAEEKEGAAADRQDEAVFADQYAAAGAFGAERAGRKSVFWNGRAQPENSAQGLV